nr:MAG TPA: hypothetical protein [Caudoviricetes sp.]
MNKVNRRLTETVRDRHCAVVDITHPSHTAFPPSKTH